MDYSLLTMIIVLVFAIALSIVIIFQDLQKKMPHSTSHLPKKA